MNRRWEGPTFPRSRLLGKNWDEVGHDGGTEDSAWRGEPRWGDFDLVETAETDEGEQTLARRIGRKLFRDGLMSVVFLGGLLLTGLVAGLIGPH